LSEIRFVLIVWGTVESPYEPAGGLRFAAPELTEAMERD